MMAEPRCESDYSQRHTEAARRVLIDIGQVLASFADCLVVVGGWTPDLLLPKAVEILGEKFASVDAFGPQQLVEFRGDSDSVTQEMQARRAYEMVQSLLRLISIGDEIPRL